MVSTPGYSFGVTESGVSATTEATNWGPARSRTVSWHDPGPAAKAAPTMSGLDFFRAMQRGEYPPPPVMALIGAHLISADPGDVLFGCTPDESLYNPIGVVHGGLACTLLDTVIGCSVHTTLPAGVAYTSIELKVSYLRPIHQGMQLRAHGWVVKPGRRVAFAEGDVRDGDDKILATASGTCLVMS
jgi:uncharacterized protein (TIGR00369 family)